MPSDVEVPLPPGRRSADGPAGGRSRPSRGCLVASLIAVGLVAAVIWWLHWLLSPQRPPPASLVPSFRGPVVVRCENTVDGWDRLERQEVGAEPARRQLVVTSDSLTTAELGRTVASSFRREGWHVERTSSGWGTGHGGVLYNDTYLLEIGPRPPVYNGEGPCDPGDLPAGSALIYITISDPSYDG